MEAEGGTKRDHTGRTLVKSPDKSCIILTKKLMEITASSSNSGDITVNVEGRQSVLAPGQSMLAIGVIVRGRKGDKVEVFWVEPEVLY